MRFPSVVFLLFILSLPAEDQLSFNDQVLPILADKCFHCHGPDEKHREAKLRLDTFEGAINKNKRGKSAVVPREPAKSLLVERIKTADEDDIMPPPDSGKSLTKKEIALLTRWVKEGAKYEKHWAFTEVKKSQLPTVKKNDWPLKDFDYYILSGIEKKGLAPNKTAAPHTLIRRLFIDLTGLPPAPEIVKNFAKNPSPQAYEKIVNQLLASDAYAERMAMVWMDASRYSDSDGFQHDKTRQNWPWKDWVINAYKNNMPFDQFTIEQLAGDLIPEATDEQKLATAFNRHHMTNGEGGRDPEESRIDYVMDRVNTVGTVWMGLSLGCAQCHTHKFDPVTQKEYYQMNAFFNSIDEDGQAGMAAKPYLTYTPKLNGAGLKDAEDWLAHVKDQQNRTVTTAMEEFDQWLSAKAHTVTQTKDFSSWTKIIATKLKTSDGAKLAQIKPGEFSVSGKNSRYEDYTITTKPNLSQITGLRIKVKAGQKGFSQHKDGHAILTNLKIFVRSKSDGIQQQLSLSGAKASFEHKGEKWRDYGPVEGLLDDDPSTGWTTKGSQFDQEHIIVIQLTEPLYLADDQEVVIELRHRSLSGFKNIRHFGLELTSEFGPTANFIGPTPSERLAGLQGRVDKISARDRELFKDEFLAAIPSVVSAQKAVRAARDAVAYYRAKAKSQKVMIMRERQKARKTHLLIGGIWNKKGAEVKSGVPERILAWPEGLKKDRLGLATWLVHKQHPLTARVTVNRYWQMIFGSGIVRTPEDFGLQGERPAHTKVLDWLAADFMENNWDVKHIIKTMVMSRTYQLSSHSSQELLSKDPENRLLARAPRYRMPSWMIRDSILKAADMLTIRTGGPPVFPFQPAGAWKSSTMGRFTYKASPGKDSYRRSLYTFWRRSIGPTNMFDSSKRRNCSIRVVRTNTPLHALNLMNDSAYVEAAGLLARHSLRKAKTLEERIHYMTFKVISRKASNEENTFLKEQYEESLKFFTVNTNKAEQLLSIGQLQNGAGKHQSAELAALLCVAQTILNLDEAISRE